MPHETEELENLAIQLIEVFKEHFPLKRVGGPSSQLYSELGIGGDDADEVITEVGTRLGADISMFEQQKYFPDEGAMIINWPFKLFRMKSELDARNFEPINFIDLARYILQHRKKGNGDGSL